MNKRMNHSVKWSQISAFRLARHHLVDQTPADFTTICQNVCGVQAQMMAAAEMQLWARTHNLTRAGIHSALYKSRVLVKTSLMRQTLHLIPAADFSIYISALKTSRVDALRRIMSKYGGITQKETEVLNGLVVEVLRDGPMTQRELTEHIMPKVGKKIRTYMKLAWSIQLFRPALVEGLICYGPERDKKATFVRVDQWLPKHQEVPALEAKQILLRRYLRTYGPATLRDFSKWAGMSMAEVSSVWGSIKEELSEVSIEGKKGFILNKDYEQLADSDLGDQIVRLLPHFDPYMLGHAEKNHLIDSTNYKRVYSNQGWILPVILLNGRVIGGWSYTHHGKRWVLMIEPFGKFSKIIYPKIEEEAASLGNFLETSWEIKFTE
jgi:hypothetical protein